MNEKDIGEQLPETGANETEHPASETMAAPESGKKGCSPWLKLGCLVISIPIIYQLGFLMTLFVQCSGIGKFHPSGDDWKEEVQLSDGTVVTIRRTIAGAPYQEAGGYAEFRTARNTVEVIDAQGLDIPPRWEEKWKPLLLDRDAQGKWFLIVSPTACHDWSSNFPYRRYEVRGNQWQPVEFDPLVQGRKSNLEWRPKIGSMPKLLKLEAKPFEGNDAYRAAPRFIWIDPQKNPYFSCPAKTNGVQQ